MHLDRLSIIRDIERAVGRVTPRALEETGKGFLPVQFGEVVLGTVTSAELKSLFYVVVQYDGDAPQYGVAKALFWAEALTDMGQWSAFNRPGLAIREGWQIVQEEEDRKGQGITD